MTAIKDSQMVNNLQAAIAQKEAECRREVEQVRARYERQIQSLRETISLFEYSSNGGSSNGHANGHVAFEDMRPLLPSVGEDKIELVRQCLRQRGFMRQAEIAPLIGINSGSVSVALRHLHANKEAKPGKKVNGSQVWEYIPE